MIIKAGCPRDFGPSADSILNYKEYLGGVLMTTSRQPGFFRAIIHPQSYINILYLLLGLPLGIAYFVILVTGISLGFGLVVIWVGVPILLLVFAVSWALCQFERVMTNSLLKEDIPDTHPRMREKDGESLSFEERLFVGAWRRLRGHLANRLTWTGMFYLFLRFPLGIATFTIAVTLISVSLGLLFAPAYMWTSDPVEWSWLSDRSFDPFTWSWILVPFGVPALFISINLMNWTAFLSGRLARLMLATQNVVPEDSVIDPEATFRRAA